MQTSTHLIPQLRNPHPRPYADGHSGDADLASATRHSVLREPTRAIGRSRCFRIQNEDRTLTKKKPPWIAHGEYGFVLDNRPHYEAVEKGQPISGVLGTANSCTVIFA